ncbi:MAG TPA: PQQ-binding-like beta-propeller repeat protein [Actinocrinis sp.]|nr:PQQ-binding-like beta-propeller repeat protein [Actinocrinis sp.]
MLSSRPITPIALGPADWPTYNRDNGRGGVAPDLQKPGALAVAWHAPLDGAVYGQPLVLGKLVVAATENDTVYGLDAATGHVLWHTTLGRPQPHSGLPCGDIDPLGITSTMAYDPATGTLFALAEVTGGRHYLAALDPSDGTMVWKTEVESPRGAPLATQQRGALTVAFGRVYVPFGGLYGDCGFYNGSVVSVPVGGTGAQQSYAVPTQREAGIWTPGGLAVSGNTLFASAGNGEAESGAYDGSDSVIALSPDLKRTDYFAPTTWATDNAADLDLGAMSPALIGDNVLIVGKSGTGYALRRDHLGGIGGEFDQKRECAAFGSASVSGTTAYVSCPEEVRAMSVTAAGIADVWRTPIKNASSATVGGGAVWDVDYSDGILYELGQNDGHVIAQVSVGPATRFTNPTLSGNRAYIGTVDGVTAVSGV